MKRLLLLGIIILLASSLGGTASFAEEIFWNRDKLPDPTITDKDFKLHYGSSTVKSFGDSEIYDVEKNLPQADKSVRIVAPAEESPPPPMVPRVRTQERRTEPLNRPEPPARKTDTAPRQFETTPKPAETMNEDSVTIKKEPVRSQVERMQKQKSTPAPEAETTPTPPKKMKWGIDAGPAEQKSEDKPKFQWGR
ncbi:MAG TPA: hypothetical protein VK463_12235 [Desulfomonilaceae bacterium]|nr:hypothetical protein [Desulfomonilaceae bacterium]